MTDLTTAVFEKADPVAQMIACYFGDLAASEIAWLDGVIRERLGEEWRPIDEAPRGKAVIVTDGNLWTLATLRLCEAQVLQLRWPFISYVAEPAWTFACSRYRRIDFKPTHFRIIDIPPPLVLRHGQSVREKK